MNASLNFMFAVVVMVVLTDYAVIEEDQTIWLWKALCPSGAVELPPVDGIKSRCFESCRYLMSVIIPDTVTVIQPQAFFECPSLANITLPVGLTEMSEDSFYKCPCLGRVVMGVGVSPRSLPVTVFWIEIHSGITVIPARFFSGCSFLRIVELPDTIEELGEGAFEWCHSLADVGCHVFTVIRCLPPKVKTIPPRCFYGCSSLETISIPESVTCIGSHAFAECRSLFEVVYFGRTMLTDTTALPSGVSVYVDCGYRHPKLCGIGVKPFPARLRPLFTEEHEYGELGCIDYGLLKLSKWFMIVGALFVIVVAGICNILNYIQKSIKAGKYE